MPRYVTLTLYVHEDLTGPSADTDTAAAYMRSCIGGEPPVVVSSWAAAYKILRALGLNAEEARHRINFAQTGDMYATRTAAGRRVQRRHPVDGEHGEAGEVAELRVESSH